MIDIIKIPKKIIYILPHLPDKKLEGTERERSLREAAIVRYSRSLGFKCELFLLTYAKETKKIDDGIGTWLFSVDDPKAPSKKHTSKSMLKRIEAEKPDLVVFKGLRYWLCRWLVNNSSHPLKFAFIVGGDVTDVMLSRSEYVFAESKRQLDEHFKTLLKKGRASVLPKIIDKSSFVLSGRKKFDIINVGNFIEWKNQKALQPFFESYRVALIGDGSLYSSIKKIAKPYGGRIFMPGNVAIQEVAGLISQARVMVHPALHEGVPRAIMESFACGVPVIALRATLKGAFEHGIQGLLVEPEDLFTATVELLNDPVKLQKMSLNAIEFSKKNCDKRVIMNEVEKMYCVAFGHGRGKAYAFRTKKIMKLRSYAGMVLSLLQKKKLGFRT